MQLSVSRLLLLAGLLLVALPARVSAAPLQPLIDGAADGQLSLNAGTVYTGGAYVGRDLVLRGNGARIEMPAGASIHVASGANLTMQDVTIAGGNSGVFFAGGARGTLTRVRIEDAGWAVSISGPEEIRLRQVELDRAQHVAITMAADGVLDAEGLTVRNTPNGLQMHRGRATIRDSVFRDIGNGFAYSGRLEMTNTVIEDLSGQAVNANTSMDPTPLHPLFIANGVTVRNCRDGVFIKDGLYAVADSHFENLPHGVHATGRGGHELPRSSVVRSHFHSIGDAAIQHNEEGELLVEDCEFHHCHGGISMFGQSRLEARRLHMDSRPRAVPGIGIALRFGAEMTLEEAGIYGFLNSLDAYGDCRMTVRNSRFVEPLFSGIIARDNTEIDVRHSEFIDNGQDGIFSDGQDEVRPGRGTIAYNHIIRAGAGEIYLPAGRDERTGTGIAVKGGHWVIEGNSIGESYDVGIAVQARADAVLRGNAIYDSRLSGIVLDDPHPEPRVHDGNIVTGHTGEEQVGILVIGSGGQPVFRRAVIARNRAGVRLLASGSTVRLEDSAVLLNNEFGVDAIRGSANFIRTTIGNNADWGIFIGSQFSSAAFEECDIVSASGKGIYNNAPTVFPAHGLYWGPGANRHRLQVSSTAPVPHRDVAFRGMTGNAESSFFTSRLPENWFSVSNAALGRSGAVVYTARRGAYHAGVDVPGWGASVPGGALDVIAFRPEVPPGTAAAWEVLLPGQVPADGALVLADEGGSFVPLSYAVPEGLERLRAMKALEDLSQHATPLTLRLVPGDGIPELRRLLGLPDQPPGHSEAMNRLMDTNRDGAIDAADIVRRFGSAH